MIALKETELFYSRGRTHRGIGNQIIQPDFESPLAESEIRCRGCGLPILVSHEYGRSMKRTMNTLVMVLLATLASFVVRAGELELSRTDHPRMLLYGAQSAKQIHGRIHDNPHYLAAKQGLTARHDSNYEVAGRQQETMAAIYVVERSQGFDEKLYRNTLKWLFTEKLPHNEWNAANWVVVGQSFLLDALWNDMDTQGDASTRGAAVEVLIDSVNYLNGRVDAHRYVCCDYGNQGFLRMLPVYPAAILLKGHEPWKEQVDAWWERMEDFVGGKRDWYAAAHQMTRGGGGWPEGMGYHSYCGGQISMVAAALHSATTLDLAKGGGGRSRNDVLRQSEYYFWAMLPGRQYFNLDNGSNSPSIRWGSKQYHFSSYGLIGPAKSLTKHLLDVFPPERYGPNVSGPFILAYDPAILDLDLKTLPHSRVFAGEFDGREYPDGSGTVIWRSGWDARATVLLVEARNRYTGHQHADAGSFYLFREGFLVTENPGKANAATEHHNSYLIDGEGMAHGNNPHLVYRELESTTFDEGDVLAHETSDLYTYAKFSFGRSYKVMPELALREIVVLNPGTALDDPLVVVADRVRTVTETAKSFLMHTRTKPVDGKTPTITADDGKGRLFARILLPAGATWSGEPNGGAYRNRVESKGTDLESLTILQASTTKTEKMLETERVTGSRGLLVAERCVVFARDASTRKVSFTHPRSSERIFYVICGQSPGMGYQVKVERGGSEIAVTLGPGSELTASRAGVVAFYGSTHGIDPVGAETK